MKRFIQVLLGFNAIALVHLVRLDPGRFLRACFNAYVSAKHTLPRMYAEIPMINLNEIVGNQMPLVRLAAAQDENGMLPIEQAMVLLSILVTEAPKEVLEIGTFMGHTTRLMAENLETATIHTVDLPVSFSAEADPEKDIPKDDFHIINSRVVGREYRDRPCAKRIIQHFADTAVWDFRESGRPGFYFIDGSHTYEYCKNDSEKSFALADKGAVFLWHDCDEHHPGVVRYISECRRAGMDIKRISGTPIAYWKSH